MPGLLAYVPTAQLAQSYWDGDPVESKNFPAPQLTQEVCSLFSLYFPRSQEVQEVDSEDGLYVPRPQIAQVEDEVAATVLLERPATQLTQAEIAFDSVFSLYCPAAQSVHVVAPTFPLHFPGPQFAQAWSPEM